MRQIDIFTGSGVFAYAASQVFDNHEPVVFCEQNKQCQKVLQRRWPDTPCVSDIRDLHGDDYESIDLISGGDPCPVRSKARSNGKSKTPDLSGHFLRLVGEGWPRWVLRENVPSRDDVDFTTALELLGYGAVIVRTDAAPFTGQQRIRDFVVASNQEAWESTFRELCELQWNQRYYTPGCASRQVIPCLTTQRQRYDSRDCYIYDGRLRVLDGDERQRFAGMPKGWLDGCSQSSVARMTGNAVVPDVVEVLMQMMEQVDEVMEAKVKSATQQSIASDFCPPSEFFVNLSLVQAGKSA